MGIKPRPAGHKHIYKGGYIHFTTLISVNQWLNLAQLGAFLRMRPRLYPQCTVQVHRCILVRCGPSFVSTEADSVMQTLIKVVL